MSSPNIHKLIGAFLLIAVITSSAAFGFSYIKRGSRSTEAQQNGASVPQNAFVESVPEGGRLAPVRQEANLTDGLAEALAAKVIAANPSGPVTQGGQLTAVFPGDADAFLKDYLASHPIAEDAIFPQLTRKDIVVASGDLGSTETLEVLKKYVSGLEGLGIVKKDAQELAGGSASSPEDPEAWLAETKNDFDTDLDALKGLEVTQSEADLQIALVELLSASENFLGLVERDPVAGAALANKFEAYTGERSAKIVNELQKGVKGTGAFAEHRKMIAALFGIPVAEAQVGVPITNPVLEAQATAQTKLQAKTLWQKILHYAKYVWEITKDILTEYAKNTLLREMTRQTINWVLGNGEPQFVTNWQGFLRNSADEAIGAVIAEAAPKLCGAGLSGYLGGFADLVKGLIKPVDIGAKRFYPTCTLTEAVQNVEDFRDDIRNGGWLAYSSVFEPQNTFLGQIFSLSERAAKRVAEEREALVSKVDKGYKPVEKCPQGSTLSKTSNLCLDDETGENVGEPQITAPANIAGGLTVRSFDVAYDRLVNARDWKALAAFVLDAMISKLVVAGVNGLGGTANLEFTDSGGTETPALSVEGRTDQVIQFKSQALASARAAVDTMSQTIGILGQVSGTCSGAVAGDAANQRAGLENLREDTGAAVVGLDEALGTLAQFKRDIAVKKYTFKDLDAQFGKGGKTAFDTAQGERQKFGKLRDDMNEAMNSASDIFSSCGGSGIDTEGAGGE